MFRWYRDASKCYVYLSDVSIQGQDASNQSTWELAFRKCRWFTRGWTLQELIAPATVEFFSLEGKRLCDKGSHKQLIEEITGIPGQALQGSISHFSVSERLFWAENRETTREEDEAYSLMGIFDVFISPIYGEGKSNARIRLQDEINKRSKVKQPVIDPETQSLLNNLPIAADAPFNAYNKQHEPICLPDTRVCLLQEIYSWADGQDDRILFWLNGLAGTGKSTIARTVSRKYFDQGRLGASFFFSRGGGEVGRSEKFVTSIAIQLANSIPALQHGISEAIAQRKDIAGQTLRDQWNHLVLNPLSMLSHASHPLSYILVVDALDECDNDLNIRILVQLLAEARSLKAVQLRVFLTSRPETPIRYGFYQIPGAEHQEFVLHNISQSIVDHDISIFLDDNLRAIGQDNFLKDGWPDPEIVQQLVQNASGLFIWAATACRFIREGLFAEERISLLLERQMSSTSPEGHLNGIYTTVLSNSIHMNYTEQETQRFYTMLRDILGSLVVLFSPLSIESLSKLLLLSMRSIERSLNDLHAIINIPKEHKQPLRLHHPSFRDFLLNSAQCQDLNFWVNETQAHQRLAESCIQVMLKSLKENICDITIPGTLVGEVDSSQVQKCIPQEVQYACLYWVQHLQKSGSQLKDNDMVHQFLQKHLLHWLEALSWMQKLSEGILSVISLESTAVSNDCPQLYAFIHDIKRFTQHNRTVVEKAPLQLYCSALYFAPKLSIVRNQYTRSMVSWIRRGPQVQENWGALLQTLEGHSDWVRSVAFSPDSKRLASCSDDRTIRLWDTSTGAPLQTLKGHSDWVMAIAFSPDGGKVLASGSRDHTAILWDTATEAPLQTLRGHTLTVNTITFSPNGNLLASGSMDSTVRLWEAATGAPLETLEGHFHGVNSVAFSPDSRVLASGSVDRAIRVWTVATGALLHTLEGHFGSVEAIAFLPDESKLLASGSEDTTVKLWDAATGALLQTLEGHSKSVMAIDFSPDGKLLASSSEDRVIRLWDITTGATLQKLEGNSSLVNSIQFSPNGKLLASASSDTMVRLWDPAMRWPHSMFEGHPARVWAVTFSFDGKLLASGSNDTVRLWDGMTGALLQTLRSHSGAVTVLIFSPDGGKLLSSSRDDNTVILWDVATGVPVQKLVGILGYSYASHGKAFSPDASKILTSSQSGDSFMLWDVATGAMLQKFGHNSCYVTATAFSPDGGKLLASSDGQMVKLWDAETGALLQKLEGHSHNINALTFSPVCRKLLASSSTDSTVKLWETATGALLKTLMGHSGSVKAIAFTRDGSKLLTSSLVDKTVRLWDTATGALLQTLAVWGPVYRFSFSIHGQYVETNRGRLDISGIDFQPATVTPTHSIIKQQPVMSLQGVFIEDEWIRNGGNRMLWLPPEYRPSCSDVHDGVIGLGHLSGNVSLFEFDFSQFSH